MNWVGPYIITRRTLNLSDGRAPNGYIYGGPAGNGPTGGSGPSGTIPGHQMAFQANTGSLISCGAAGNLNTHQGMMAGTSPAIAASPSGGYRAAFQANTGNLFVFDSTRGAVNQGQGMRAGTSPSITALPGGGYQMAFQANTGNLISFGEAGNSNTGQGMRAGTSPAITR